MVYIPESLLEAIESHKKEGRFDEAMKLVNGILVKDPKNSDALMQVADIAYRKGELAQAQKPIDFLLKTSKTKDPMSYYVKGVIEMEKNNRSSAKEYFYKALQLTDRDNHEILRCYGLSEYRYGNREKGLDLMEQAFEVNSTDAEVVYNLIELYLLEFKYSKAKSLIKWYQSKRTTLNTFDKSIDYYDQKIGLFQSYLQCI